jgi:beta-glucanase (GH16 family)
MIYRNLLSRYLAAVVLAGTVVTSFGARGEGAAVALLPRAITNEKAGHPAIVFSPPSQTAFPGSIISLSAAANGPAPLRYQWQAGAVGSGLFTNLTDGGQFSGAAASVLTISNVTAGSMLDYRALVANNSGFATSAVATVTVPAGWQLVWSDEFDGTNLDTTKWTAFVGNTTGGDVWYTGRTNNVYVANGLLHLVAQRESLGHRSYTSGQARTEFKYAKKYGHIEARMKLPPGAGFWPAFWMLGTNYDYPTATSANWPRCGEIDVFENGGAAPNRVQGTLHCADVRGNDTFINTTLVYDFPTPGDSITNFHTYGIQWTSNSITWQIDGQNLRTWTNWGTASGPNAYPAPFNQPFFFLLQLAVTGVGGYGGSPNTSTPFPSEVQVDYVRVYDQLGAHHDNLNRVLR